MGWDVVFVSLEVMLWMLFVGFGSQYRHILLSPVSAATHSATSVGYGHGYARKLWLVAALCVFCPLLSVAVVFPLFLAWREVEYLRDALALARAHELQVLQLSRQAARAAAAANKPHSA